VRSGGGVREAERSPETAEGPADGLPDGEDPAGAPRRPVWKRNLVVLAAGQLVTVSAMGIILPFIPFFVRELGVEDRAAVERWSGLIFSGPFLTAGLMSPVWGHLGDRFGHRLMVIRAIVGLALVNFLLVFVQSPMQFWLLRLAQGIVTGFIPASLAITSASTPSDRMTGAVGRLQASASAGRLIGPAFGGMLAGFIAFRSIFVVVGTMISVAALAIILFLREPPRPAAKREATVRTGFLSVLADRRIRLGLLGLLVTMAAVSMVMPVFPLFVEDLLPEGMDASVWTGIGFATVAAFTLLTAGFVGRITRRFGLKPVLLVALGATAASLAVHPLVTGIPGLLAVRALLGIGVAGVQPVLFSMVSRLAPEGRGGGVAGFASSATIFGFFLGPFSGGWLANHVGVQGLFLLSAAATVSCAVGAALIARREGREPGLLLRPESTPR
jgi:DHA1 family multidrug resistance protein-like MFS transporter